MKVLSTSSRSGTHRVLASSAYVRAACWLIVISCASTLLLASRASAAPGDLDTSFGGGTGKVTTDHGTNSAYFNAVAVQPDGKILAAGYADDSTRDVVVIRYNANGALDTTFSGDGRVQTDIDINDNRAFALALQTDGKIVVGGSARSSSNDNFALVRYNTNGTLDTSFNSTGKVTTDMGTNNDYVRSLALQGDGKILAAGYAGGNIAVARYNTNGTLDTGFGGSGKVTTNLGGASDQGFGMAIQVDGKIIVAGQSDVNGTSDFAVVRYLADGTLDTTFNTTGMVITAIGTGNDVGNDVAIQGDGKIVVAGLSYDGATPDSALVRYQANGSLDSSFGTGGIVVSPLSSGENAGRALLVQGDGKIVVAGFSSVASVREFAVVRYNTNGTLDGSFGTGGIKTALLGSSSEANGAALQSDGRIVLAGQAWDGSRYDFAVARFLGDPSPEIVLSGNGSTISDGDQTPSLTDHTDFSSTAITGGTVQRTFTIQNTGDGDLTLGAVSVSGPSAADFTVAAQPAALVAPGGSTTFQVVFDPDAPGVRQAVLSFTTNDADEADFDFAIHGVGTGMPAPGRLVVPGHLSLGLKGWWKLDEESGTRMDSSLMGNSLMQTGAVASVAEDYWSTGESSASFAGNSSNYLSITDAAQNGLDITGSWTAAFWVRPAEVSSTKMIFEKGTQMAIYLSDLGQLYIYSGGSANPSPGGLLATGKWSHFTVAYDSASSSARVYQDGNLISVEASLSDPSNTADAFVVGRHTSSGYPMNGALKDLAVWDRVLTPLEVKSLASGIDVSTAYRPGNVSVAPTAWWKLNEVSSGTGAVSRVDSAGAHTLTDNNTVGTAGGYLDGAAADFERDNSEYFTASDSANWNMGTGDFAVSMWVRPESLGQNQDFITRSDTQFRMGLDTSNNLVWWIEGNERWTRTASGFSAGTWYHLVLRRQGGTVRVYRDGVELGAAGSSSDDIQSTGALNIGRNDSGVNHFDGQMADVAIWKGYALSDSEIKALATALPVQKAGIVSYWPLDEASGTRKDEIGTNHLSPSASILNDVGLVGSAADFEANSLRRLQINSAAQSGLNPIGALSVFGWVKPESTGSIQVIAARGYGNSGYGLSYRASGVGQFDTGPGAASSSSSVSVGTWSFLGGVWDGVRKVYFNGAIESNGAGTGPSATTHDFTIGANDMPGEYVDGLVDEVMVARRWFRDEEVKAIYCRGLNGLKAFLSSNASLSNLTPSAGTLSPAFSTSTGNYTASVGYNITSVTLTPVAAQPNALITVNGVAVASGVPSTGINLTVGENIITTIVTSEDGSTTQTYTVNVTRAEIAPGDLVPGYTPNVSGAIYALAAQPDGKIVIGGSITSVGGVGRNKIARLNADGSLDGAFNPDVSATIYSIVVQPDGRIVIGGNFVTVNGSTRNNIARLNPDGTLDTGFNPDANHDVYAIAPLQGGGIVIGGNFTTVSGVTRNRLALLNEDGTLNTGFSVDADQRVYGVGVQMDGKIVFVGQFTTVGGITRNRIARVNPDGSLDTSFNPNAGGGNLTSLVLQPDGKWLVAGSFSSIGGTVRNNIARLSTDGTLDSGFNPDVDIDVASLALQANGDILLCGSFTTVSGVARGKIARVNTSGVLDASFNPNANSTMRGVTLLPDGKILAHGSFTTFGGVPRTGLVMLHNDNAMLNLTPPDATHVIWSRIGTAPELSQVTFDWSADGSTGWQMLGAAARVGISSDWQLTGVSLLPSGFLRARGQSNGAWQNGSWGIIEHIQAYSGLPVPEITVEQPEATNLTDNGPATDFGGVMPGSPGMMKTFTIRNTGTADLTGLAVTKSGTHAADFALNTSGLSTILAAGASTTFTVTFVPATLGNRNAALQIANNDADENPFDIALMGSGAGTQSITYLSASDVPITSGGFTATGNTINLSLNFTPSPFTSLTVVNNTSADPITGTFTNLAQGQTVLLSFGGTDYRFFVDYSGGDGNDLVLVLLSPGGLDLSYGTAGKVVTSIGSGSDLIGGAALQPDGKLVVAATAYTGSSGDFAAARYTSTGVLDPTFGVAGKMITPVGSGNDVVTCMALQNDGKIIVAGYTAFSSDADFAMIRYLPDGNLDTTFGVGGKVTTSIGAGTDYGRAVALQTDGKIVVAGSSWNGSTSVPALVRYHTNGSLDSSFGNGGIVTTNFVPGLAVAIQNDGKIIVAGSGAATSTFAVVRHLPDGSLDLSFNGTGQAIATVGSSFSYGRCVAVQNDGKILVGGTSSIGSSENFAIARFTSTGTLDLSFGTGGQVITDLSGDSDACNSIILQEDGKIVLGGNSFQGSSKSFGLARYTKNGVLDTSFGVGGITTTLFGTIQDLGHTLLMEPNGKLILVGSTQPASTSEFALARYLPDTTLAASFSSDIDVPLSSKAIATDNRSLSIGLNYAPVAGTSLKVFNNTGLQPIAGEFSNLAHGQIFTLSHNAVNYEFVANYFGGDGNDLTLEWANTKLAAFGLNGSGQLGIAGTAAQANVPTQVVATAPIYQKTILSMSTGEAHSLAVCSDGTVAAWGSNVNGQLGNGTNISSPMPGAVTMGGVLNGKKVIAVAAGGQHSLALCSDGTLAAWGEGSSGQIGDNGTLDRLSPVLVSMSGALNGRRVIAISAGATHSAALCSDGTVVCWGGNTNGELGNASNTQSNVPVAVSTGGVLLGHTVTAIACGENHTLGLLLDGSVAAWGRNASGQLGNSITAPSNVPVLVDAGALLNGKRVVEIAAGGSSSFARCSDGVLAAWGSNDRGQLGVNNATTSFTVPQVVLMSGVLSGKTVTRLFAGKHHAGALCSDGTLTAWGEGNGGELGDNAVSDSLAPVLVNNTILGGTDFFIQTASGASAGHSLALIGTGVNAPMIVVEENGVPLTDSTTTGPGFGGLLIGSTASKSFIVRNTGTQTLSSLAASLTGAGVAHYAITQQPAATLAPGEATVVVVAFSPTTFGAKEAVLHLANNLSGNANPFDSKLTGTGDPELYATWLTGAEIPAQAATFDAGGKEIIFSLGYAPTAGTTLMVLRNTGTGFIDGLFDSADYGQLGQGQDVELEFNGTFYTFVANYFGGDGNDLVLQWAGTRLLAWGANTNGSLGNGGSTNSSLPVSVNVSGVLSGKRLVAAACGLRHSLALCSDGTLAAWGNNGSGQLGNGGSPTAHSNVPVLVTMSGVLLGKTPVAIAAGNDFSLALCSDGTVAAWGLNTDGQLGNDSIVSSNVPVLVDATGVLSGKIITAIAAGSTHVLARGSDGALYTWGGNSNGQLGNNSTTSSDVPVVVNGGVLAGKQVRGIAAGYFHSMVTCTDGTQAAWGDNSYGMIGDGTSTASLVPVLTDTSGVLAGKTAAQQFGGQFHSVWMASDGTLAAWGRNNNAQLGISTATPYSLAPMAVPLAGVMTGRVPVFLAGGRQHHIALLDDGTLAAWGLGSSGQLGHGATPSNAATPVAVSTTSLQAGEKVMRAYSGAGALHNISLVAKPLTLPGGPPLVSTNPATLVDKTTATLQALVNPNSLTTDARFEYGLTTSYGTLTTLQTNVGSGGSSSVSVTQNLTGLQPNTTYHYRVTATNTGGTAQGNDLTFSTLPDPPFATTGSVNINNITNSTALLPGIVNPNGRETTIYFQFGLTDQYGDSTAPQNIPAGSSNVNVNASISGLTLGTTYHFRLVAQNSGGTAYGDDVVFTTTSISPPTLTLLTLEIITTTGATLKGSVNPNGALTNAWFEYGLTTSYTGITSVAGLGSGTSPQPVTEPVASLAPATTYHYRLVAQNSAGTTQGADATFTTLPLPPTATTQAAVALSTTSARLQGTVNAQNGSAVVTFEWGTNGTDFPNSLTAAQSPVTGSSDTAVSVDISNLEQFTVYHYRVKALSTGGETTGSVLTFQPAIISGLFQQFPGVSPASDGSLTVTLSPTGILSGWRFVGERRWRASGDTATGLVHGARNIEFRPVPGYLQPGVEPVIINAAGQTADYEYYATPSTGSGGILVVLKPDALAQAVNESERGQWQLLGETTWRNSGSTAPALPAGTYLVMCKPVAGYSTPSVASIEVSSGQTANPTLVYFTASSPTGLAPVVQSFGTVSTDTTKPYAYVGQIRSNAGLSTGFIVKPRVVATAAHVVWDDGTLSAAQGLQWLFQRDAGTHDPVPLVPQGFYTFDGYAAQRTADNSPGQSSPQSQHLDVAAIYFNTNAGRDGFSGWLGSDLSNNEFLLSSADKMLVGYPIDSIADEFQGRMHATTAANIVFASAYGRTFTTSGLHSFGGNSGGPLCVQHTNGSWYPAAIYLGGTNQTVVRAIDSEVIELFNRAETSSTGGGNNTGGGITHSGYSTPGGTSGKGAAIINITPAGSGWRPQGSSKPFTPSGNTRSDLTPGTMYVEFVPVAGYETPVDQTILVVANSTETFSITFPPSQTPQESWRQTYFGSTANSGDGADDNDYDRDGFTNAEEYTAGTNPTLAGDYFKMDGMSQSAGTFTVTTSGKAGRTYVLQRSTTLAPSSWATVDTVGPLGGDGPVSLTDAARPNDAAFYRIQVTGP